VRSCPGIFFRQHEHIDNPKKNVKKFTAEEYEQLPHQTVNNNMNTEELENYFWENHVKQSKVGYYASDLDCTTLFKRTSPVRLSSIGSILDKVIDLNGVNSFFLHIIGHKILRIERTAK
jgi:hypothetical protein